MLFDLRDQSWFKNSVGLALGGHAGIDGFAHELTLEKVGLIVLRLVFYISRFLIGVISQFRFIGILNACFLSVPFGGSGQLRFATRAQVGNGFGDIFCVGIKLLDDGGLAGFHLGQFFLLIISEVDGILARIVIALERLFEFYLGLGLLRGQLRELAFAFRFLPLDGRQLAIELGNFDFLCGRLLEHLAGWSHRSAHLINRHILHQLERQQTNQWQPDDQHEALLPAMA